MRVLRPMAATGFLALALSCSAGESVTTAPSAGVSFLPAVANPGDNTVAMQPRSVTGDRVTVAIDVQVDDGVYAAAFDVVFDEAHVDFVGAGAGSFFPTGSADLFAQTSGDGRVVVVVTRRGAAPPVSGRGVLLTLEFRVNDPGDSELRFDGHPQLLDASNPPRPIPGLSWHGGTLRRSV